MKIRIDTVEDARQHSEFIDLPYRINAERDIFVPTPRELEEQFHDTSLNTKLSNCEQIRFLAYQDGECVGRIMGIIHHPSNEQKGKIVARFCRLDHIMDAPVSVELMKYMEQWARDQGASELIGPFEFDQLGRKGLLIEGINILPAWNASSEDPYVAACLLGPDKEMWFDFFSYHIPVPEEDPAPLTRIAERLRERGNFKVVGFNAAEELYPYLDQITVIYNSNCNTEYGFMPVEPEELKQIIDVNIPFTDTSFIKCVTGPEDSVVAFVLAHRCVAEMLRTKDQETSFLTKILGRKKQKLSDRVDLFTGAIEHRYRGMGIDALLALEMFSECRARGIRTIDSNLIYETNSLARREMMKLGGEHVKMYRVFGKKLS